MKYRTRLFLAGLPAVIFTLAAAAVTADIYYYGTGSNPIRRYHEAASQAMQEGDYKKAELAYRKLSRMTTGLEYRYGLLLTSRAIGDLDRAEALMNQLAPLSGEGYAPAHLLKAQELLVNPSPQTLALAERHLDLYLRNKPRDVGALFLLSQIFEATKRLEKAEQQLVLASEINPYLKIELARFYSRRENTKKSDELVAASIKYCQQKLKEDEENHEARLTLVKSLVHVKRYPEAVVLLRNGLIAFSEGRLYRRALSDIFLLWAETLGTSAQAGEKLILLNEGLQYEPNNAELLKRVAKELEQQGPTANSYRELLLSAVAHGKAGVAIHFLLGTDAWSRHNVEEARLHWEKVLQLAPTMVIAANNLAWLLSHKQSPDLNRALNLVNLALDRFPNNPDFLDTRGYIHAKLGKWKEALGDLQSALQKYPKNPELHKVLSETYKNLRAPELAEKHAKLAESYSKERPENRRLSTVETN